MLRVMVTAESVIVIPDVPLRDEELAGVIRGRLEKYKTVEAPSGTH
jgi:hypothetical protein